MNCYCCATTGQAVAAVALCRCGAALCPEHLRQTAQAIDARQPLGQCRHDTWAVPRVGRAA